MYLCTKEMHKFTKRKPIEFGMPNTYEALKSNLPADHEHSRKGEKKTNFMSLSMDIQNTRKVSTTRAQQNSQVHN